ncbi:helix-turn-helix transcriptional regulator [Pseudoflavonifractor phocaeensis]|uniref:helix-turn-helix domain-containing protein n=1 Tax=Pseudoflavonifractor phocaeensis TaxID=1870988 RepID=UPI00313CD40D
MFFDRFEELCAQKGVKPGRACREMGVSRSLAAKWKATKTEKPSADALEKMSAYFGKSINEILSGQKETPAFTGKDERDIAKRLEAVLGDLEQGQDGISFLGEALDQSTRELLAKSIQNSLEMGKALAKQKYTPKKYKKE